MSSLPSSDINFSPSSQEPEPEIAGELIELPRMLSESLWALVGQRVVVGNVTGQIRVERSSQ